MHQTNIERIRKALSNVKERKFFAINPDIEWKNDDKERKEQSHKKMESIFEYLNEMYTCKKCGKNCRLFGKRLDEKVILRTGRCFNCLIDYETELRIKGEYEEYAKKKINENAKSWLKEFKESLQDYKKQYSEEIKSYVTQDGEIEEWGGGESKDKISDLLDKLYENVEKQVFGEENTNNDEKIDEK